MLAPGLHIGAQFVYAVTFLLRIVNIMRRNKGKDAGSAHRLSAVKKNIFRHIEFIV